MKRKEEKKQLINDEIRESVSHDAINEAVQNRLNEISDEAMTRLADQFSQLNEQHQFTPATFGAGTPSMVLNLNTDELPPFFHQNPLVVRNAEGQMVRVPHWFARQMAFAEFVHKPKSIKLEMIQQSRNLEARSILISLYGYKRFILNSGAFKVQSDEWGTLWLLPMQRMEAIMMVEVVNSTPEPDGSFKNYFLRVPPTMKTAKEAIAWTFDEDEYDPDNQT